ncbi:hypothetical protein [Parvularcula marina]|uniref:hypothetical protein n=1 Tax=Parvularcula marina TaxID=2292771 RepID=UPI0035123444
MVKKKLTKDASSNSLDERENDQDTPLLGGLSIVGIRARKALFRALSSIEVDARKFYNVTLPDRPRRRLPRSALSELEYCPYLFREEMDAWGILREISNELDSLQIRHFFYTRQPKYFIVPMIERPPKSTLCSPYYMKSALWAADMLSQLTVDKSRKLDVYKSVLPIIIFHSNEIDIHYKILNNQPNSFIDASSVVSRIAEKKKTDPPQSDAGAKIQFRDQSAIPESDRVTDPIEFAIRWYKDKLNSKEMAFSEIRHADSKLYSALNEVARKEGIGFDQLMSRHFSSGKAREVDLLMYHLGELTGLPREALARIGTRLSNYKD